MGQIIYVDFKNKTIIKIIGSQSNKAKLTKPIKNSWLTKGELFQIERRVDAINMAIEKCNPIFDTDITENLERELDQIIDILENKKRGIR